MLGFYTFAGPWSSQLADHMVNEINQGPRYVKMIKGVIFFSLYIEENVMEWIINENHVIIGVKWGI